MSAYAYASERDRDDQAGAWADRLRAEGYCIIPGLVPEPDIAALWADLASRFARTPFCQGDFYGARTKRFGGVLKRSPRAAGLVAHPLVLAVAERVLRGTCDCLQLNLTQGLEIHPGQGAQPPHRDEDMWGGPKGSMEYLLNVMWPFNRYTAENGATMIWPRSHHGAAGPAGDPIAAEMGPGSALLFLGSTLHGGGANRAPAPRTGLVVSYCLGWLKPYENQWLVYPPEVARRFPRALSELVGYRQHRPNLGNYEGQCPSVLLRDRDSDYLGAVDALRPEQAAALAARRLGPIERGGGRS